MRGDVRRSRRLGILAAVVAVLVVTGVVAWVVLRDDDTARPVTAVGGEVSAGPVTVRYPDDAFPEGEKPSVELTGADDEFLAAFAVPGVESVVADVTASTQPATAVEIDFAFDPSALPENAVPSIFYFDEELDLWLPIPTEVDAEGGRLVGSTDHFTWFTTALTTAIKGVEAGAQWLRYQTARAVGARAGALDCGTSVPPRWVIREDTDQGLNDPLPTCLATTPDGDLEVHVVVNRAYSLALSGPAAPRTVEYRSIGNTSDLLYQTLSRQFDVVGADAVYLPSRVETVLTYAQNSLPPGRVEFTGHPTPAAVVMDVVVAAGEVLVGTIPHAATALIGMVDCVADAVSAALDGVERLVGAAVEAVQSCTEPILAAAGASASAATKRLMVAIQAVWLAGRGAQTALDGATAWQEPADVILRVQAPGPDVPAGAVLLSDVLLDSGGVGPSGAAIDVTLGNVEVPYSTSQWVGCDDTAAWGTYALDGRRRLTALLGLRDFTPLELVVGVRVLVDGVLVEEFVVDGPAIDIDLQLPPGDVLLLEAQRLSGTCSGAPEGYGVWGNGALS